MNKYLEKKRLMLNICEICYTFDRK